METPGGLELESGDRSPALPFQSPYLAFRDVEDSGALISAIHRYFPHLKIWTIVARRSFFLQKYDNSEKNQKVWPGPLI
ncbi:hypothetical protein TSAR_003493 [Trichomalopsis sarcophagae]|uniref:Uncharacterized protein n=1 Tax=Trichomalopsis sarcophagae TaxID=543379 RepID=A0A232EL48_9HYME|nr:hypothetical protein TSAR_003493 [Trichomalopsis sarcophagae]